MSLRLEAVTFPADDPAVVGGFWAGMLGRDAIGEPGGVFVPGDDTQVGLRFVHGTVPASRPLHLHLTSAGTEQQGRVVDEIVRRGGRRRGTAPPPPGRDIYMSDPAGYDFCVIKPGSAFLEECGLLGEVTCDGGRQAGLFWRDALGWPLVWDHGEQTAIQAPTGGTKISWDRWTDQPAADISGVRFDLRASDQVAEIERLLDLGATLRGDRDGAVRLTDPGGGAFWVVGRRRHSLS